MEEEEHTYYAVLNIPRHATEDEVHKAFRALAKVCHPDKQRDPELHGAAQESFSRLQEAYEVLSDPEKRQVYDVYGKEGLASGMEVGEHLGDPGARQREFERQKAKAAEEATEAAVQPRGYYKCQVDATELVRQTRGLVLGPDAAGPSPAAAAEAQIDRLVAANRLRPAIAEKLRAQVKANGQLLAMDHHLTTQELRYPVGESAAATFSGQVIVKRARNALQAGQFMGGGTVNVGYSHSITPLDSLDLGMGVGMKSYGNVTTTRQIDALSSASLSLTYNPEEGVGMQLSTHRHLWEGFDGNVDWVLGPESIAGMSMGVTWSHDPWVLVGKVDIGTVAGVVGKASYRATDRASLRAVAKAGATGADLELGGMFRVTQKSHAYFGVQYGLQGAMMRMKVHRGDQTFEFPVLLSRDPKDWQTLAASYILPPIAGLVLQKFVIGPLVKLQERRRQRKILEERRERVVDALAEAARDVAVLTPVARRRVAAEGPDGLVIVKAVYGMLDDWRALPLRERFAPECGAPRRSETPPDASGAGAAEAATQHTPVQTSEPGPEASAASGGGEEDTALPAPPPRFLDVTSALQFLVAGGSLTLHAGVPKHGLMGFADPAPATEKALYVAFGHASGVYEATAADLDPLELPRRGAALEGDSVEIVKARVAEIVAAAAAP